MRKPYFSIIMPAYNRAYCIKNAIDSLLAQSCQDFELIIVDDGSTDGTEELINQTYAKEIATGKIIYQESPHKGAAAARNIGLAKAQGKWIGYLDTDNTIIKDFLKTYQQAIKEHPKAKIFYAQMHRINQDKSIGHAWDEKDIFTTPFIDMGTFIHHKECVKKYGGFDENLSRLIDYEFILRLTRFYEPVFIEKVVLNYNDAADVPRITTTEDRTQALCYIKDKYKGYEEQIKQNNLTAKQIKENDMSKIGLKLARLMHLINKDKYNEKRQIALIEASPLFDKKWYLNQNPDVKKRKMRAAKHYIKIGYKEKRNPSPYFDGKDYLKRYKDVAKQNINPLIHYVLYGAKEGRYYNEVACPARLLVQNDIDFQPKISVVIPVYNAEAFLDELLDSITGQTLKEIEIICVDDGSTDNSLEILKKYAQKDNRIIIMQQNNMHAGVARNSGISVAKGEYIHFMDADDWLYDKNVYKNLYNIAREQKFCNIIRFKGKAFDYETNEEIENRMYERINIDKKYENSFVDVLQETKILTKLSVVPWLGIVKTDFVKKNNLKFNNLTCCNDRSFFITSELTAQDIYLADLYVVRHRVNMSGSLRGIRDQHFDCHFKSITIIQEFLQNKKIASSIVKQIMVCELSDLMAFFKKYVCTSIYGYQIYKSTTNFVKRYDLADYEPYINKIQNYNILVALSEKKGKTSRLDYFVEKYFNHFAKKNSRLSNVLKFALTYPIRIAEEYDQLKTEIKKLESKR